MDTYPQQLVDVGIFVSLTRNDLDIPAIIASVKSPKAGAVVLFAGTTRDNSEGKRVVSLAYESYPARALKTMHSIAEKVKEQHALTAISLVHRIGNVPIGEESILIAASAPHRQAAWAAGEQALEECKKNTEIWKKEQLREEDGTISTVWSEGHTCRRA